MVYINARFLTQPITGVQRFAIEISKQLVRLIGENEIVFLSPRSIIHKELIDVFHPVLIGKRSGHFWEQVELPSYLKKNKSPLLLNLCSTAPICYKNQIVTHHDITYIRFPISFSKQFRLLYKFLIPQILKHSQKIITVSQFSLNEISNYFKIPKSKFLVLYNGVDKSVFYNNPQKNSKSNYILAVSSKNYHKNFHGLIKSFKELSPAYSDIKLYIVGASGISSFNSKSIEDLNNGPIENSNIHFLGRVDDEKLRELYQNALFFVFPSLYEGFGIPPIEAQACGCVVLASNQASIPEVLGNSALFFDPYTKDDLKIKMEALIKNADLLERFAKEGMNNAFIYEWKNSAKNLVDYLHAISN